MWTANGNQQPSDLLGSLEPQEVLIEYDGPRTFTLELAGDKLGLAHQCGQDSNQIRFVVVETTKLTIEELKQGRVDLRSVLNQSTIWLADVSSGWSVVSVIECAFGDIPTKYLPQPGATLYPTT